MATITTDISEFDLPETKVKQEVIPAQELEPPKLTRPRGLGGGVSNGNGKRKGNGAATTPTQTVAESPIVEPTVTPKPIPKITTPSVTQPRRAVQNIIAPVRISSGFGFESQISPKRISRRKGATRRLRRQPSLISAVLGIESAAPIFGEGTGLIPRPLIKKRRKR